MKSVNPVKLCQFLFLVLALSSTVLVAQVPAPQSQPAREKIRQDPLAVKAFREMINKVYRPRRHGLETIDFDCQIVSTLGTEVKRHGPFVIHWDYKKGHKFSDPLGVDVPANESAKSLQAAVKKRIVADLVGHEAFENLKKNHFSLDAEKRVIVEIPTHDHAKTVVRKMILAPDEFGRLKQQTVLGPNNVVLAATTYIYRKEKGNRFVVDTRRTSQATQNGNMSLVLTYTHQNLGDFTFAKTIRYEQATSSVVYTYTVKKINGKKPGEKPKTPPTSRPDSRPSEK